MELAYAAFRQKDTDAESIETRLKESLDSACANATRSGHPPEHVQDALYATVSWIDELAMSFDLPGSSAWRLSPLSSEERRVGQECVSTCRSRWRPCD